MRRGRAFTIANPPSRMSATVIGRSAMAGHGRRPRRPRRRRRGRRPAPGRVHPARPPRSAPERVARRRRRARPSPRLPRRWTARSPPHAAARTGAAGWTGDVVLHCAIIAHDEDVPPTGEAYVDGYGASTYGDRFADVYDDWYERRLRRRRRPSSGSRPWRGPGGRGARAGGGQRSAGRAAGRTRASRCGRSTPRPPCSTGCGPGPAATGSHAVVDDMARLSDPALAEARRVRGRPVRVQHAVQPHRHRRPAALPGAGPRPAGARRAAGGRGVRPSARRARATRPSAPSSPATSASTRWCSPSAGSTRRPARSPASTCRSPSAGCACGRGCCTTRRPTSSTRWPPRPGCALVERHAGWQGEPFTAGIRTTHVYAATADAADRDAPR